MWLLKSFGNKDLKAYNTISAHVATDNCLFFLMKLLKLTKIRACQNIHFQVLPQNVVWILFSELVI